MIKNKVRLYHLSLFLICCLGVYAGLADGDYYWQADLGKQIVSNGDFYGCYNQIWGSLGVYEYYDHEWLTNIVFYLFSLIPYRPLVWLKLFICCLTGLEFICLSKKFYLDNDSKRLISILFLFIYATVFLKIKAYSLSVIFFIEELILLKEYLEKPNKKTAIKLIVLCILWNNMHSGSMPLFFATAGVFWLISVRDKKSWVPYGIICLLSTLINPYGYKLLVFDFKHNGDSAMKTIVQDWKCIDGKTVIGMLCVICIIAGVAVTYRCIETRRSYSYLALLTLVIILAMQSARHLIYFFPLVFILLSLSNINITRIKINYSYVSFACAFLVLLNCYSVFSLSSENYDISYAYDYIDDELESIILDTVDSSDGIYNTTSMTDMLSLGLKSFAFGGYPLVSDRVKDSYVIENTASVQNIENIIDYYGLDKFVICKYNLNCDFYTLHTVLYDYLISNDNYIELYDSDKLCYFIRKDLIE